MIAPTALVLLHLVGSAQARFWDIKDYENIAMSFCMVEMAWKIAIISVYHNTMKNMTLKMA